MWHRINCRHLLCISELQKARGCGAALEIVSKGIAGVGIFVPGTSALAARKNMFWVKFVKPQQITHFSQLWSRASV